MLIRQISNFISLNISELLIKFCDMKINGDCILWTKEEDLLITDNISLKTEEIAKLIPHRTKCSVQARKNRLVKFSKNNAD